MQIIVLGMHRSGTSALGRILNMMNCYFGPEDVSVGASFDNPKGFWERKDVVEINDLILRLSGGSWWDVGRIDYTIIKEAELERINEKIANTIIKLDSNRPWFVKDPRMCLTIKYWLPYLESPVILFSVRTPVQIASSLKKRNNLPVDYSILLWEYYLRTAFSSIADYKYKSISYKSLMSFPYDTCQNLFSYLLDENVSGLKMPNRDNINAFIDQSLYHHREEDLKAHLTPQQLELHNNLLNNTSFLVSQKSINEVQDSLEQLKEEMDITNKIIYNAQEHVPNAVDAQPSDSQMKSYFDLEKELGEYKLRYADLKDNYHDLELRNAELKNALHGLLESRSIKIIAFLYKIIGLRNYGLAAERKRLINMLSGTVNDYNWNECFKRYKYNFFELVNLAIRNPSLLKNLTSPKKIKKAYKIASERISGYDINNRELLKSYEKNQYYDAFRCKAHESYSVKKIIEIYNLLAAVENKDNEEDIDCNIEEWILNIQELLNDLKGYSKPIATIIIPVHNQVRYTLACLHSILINAGMIEYEIIVADDCSSDLTEKLALLDSERFKYIRNNNCLGFLRNCNQAVKHAEGEHIVFLNNDTIVLEDWLKELIDTLLNDSMVGLVGSRLIYPDGYLQEAGGAIFKDGSGCNIGRYKNPSDPKYNFFREVDYCSGASIAIPKHLWENLKGFDCNFTPAYYEDTDLAFRVRSYGKKVIYNPFSSVIHFEGISHGTNENEGIKQYQVLNKEKFKEKWYNVLNNCKNGPSPKLHKRSPEVVLYFDASTPTPDRDSGSADTYNYMKILLDLGYHVVFVPGDLLYFGNYTRALQRIGVECLYLPWVASFEDALQMYGEDINIVIMSRAYIANKLLPLVEKHAPNAKIIYDTVDLHFLREMREAELVNSKRLKRKAEKTKNIELKLIRSVDATLFRSEYEIELVNKLVPNSCTVHMPIVRDIPGRGNLSWEERKDIVFIGGFSHPPNEDAVYHFIESIWPILNKLGYIDNFLIVGSNMPNAIKKISRERVIVKGYVDSLEELFGRCRLSLAPLRYGAGVKGKVISSLSYGVPCVASSVATEGTGFINGKHLLVEDDPYLFAEAVMRLYYDHSLWQLLSEKGLEYCYNNFSFDTSKSKFEHLLEDLATK